MTTTSQGENKLFRERAMQAVGGRNRLNTLSPVISPRLWVFAAALGFLVVSVIAWGFLGDVPVAVYGTGVFLRGERITALVAPLDGQVSAVLKRPGDEVKAGDVIVRLRSQEAQGVEVQEGVVMALEAGRVTSVNVVTGDAVRDGQHVCAVVGGRDQLRCVAFLPLSDAKLIEPGFPALMHFVTRTAGTDGEARGKVVVVESFMTTTERILQRIPNADFVRMVQERFGTVCEVEVEVQESTLSDPVTTGVPCDIEIIVDHVRPVELVFPGLRSKSKQ
ncbi:MAG: biotin/lipoyl-binding protein [Phycisphaerae bacterium]|nr:biotin/lipoyl-binding protein [Phycisphaerae bacterium]